MAERCYVVETMPRAEFRAEREISDLDEGLGITPELPICVYRIRHARKTELRRAPLLPNYLFVWAVMTDDVWSAITTRRSVKRLLGVSSPKSLPDIEICRIRAKADEYRDIVCEAVPFTPLQAVKIIEGAFTGLPAKISAEWKDDAARPSAEIVVDVNILGGVFPIELPRDTIAPVR